MDESLSEYLLETAAQHIKTNGDLCMGGNCYMLDILLYFLCIVGPM